MSDKELVDYLKSLNPTPEQQAILIYGKEYKLWREGEFIGTGIWTKDENVGDSFQVRTVNDKGEFCIGVLIADKWELCVK